ncbi:SCO6745 family protein [Crossiella sp. CA198]|uniref:SCO6745 family protein n=1 Tax=Crossiella sp. CA198 TaxID=3455607 RepID=UPI003F8D3686
MTSPVEVAEATRKPLVKLGGVFMTSPQMNAHTKALELPRGGLYFRGRSAVLGDPSSTVVAELYGIFPKWLMHAVIPQVTQLLPATAAVAEFSAACWEWGREALAEVPEAARTAELLFQISDGADAGNLPLFAGWREAPRPEDTPARLAHALNLVREYRGGLHFGALRACGIGIAEALAVNPESGKQIMTRLAWQEEEADALIARTEANPDLPRRWRQAEELTDNAMGRTLADTLSEAELVEFRELMRALPTP